ncbi:hypothetical protein N657DRAFT_697790 [Parathielavia appendiculata]|uniref:Uncharacterized protein n=1 Tax=Parathielavia appendiculata TaxID=2587402 RepID=A0AAN6Z9Y6_9PEZI|nr:hypothetical protein N657DRAFT_697790 [Parathielavia appendiculata]
MAAFNGPRWLIGASTATPLPYILSPLPCPSTAWSINHFYHLKKIQSTALTGNSFFQRISQRSSPCRFQQLAS